MLRDDVGDASLRLLIWPGRPLRGISVASNLSSSSLTLGFNMAPFIGDDADKTAGPYPDISIAIDRGGTFCDVIAKIEGRDDIILKLLSEDPNNYSDAPTEAIRRVLEIAEGRAIPVGEKLDGSRIGTRSVAVGVSSRCNGLTLCPQ